MSLSQRHRFSPDFLLHVALGSVPDYSMVHKFGRNAAVGTSFEPVALGGVWNTPQPASATAFRVKAGGNANDTAAGSGAREVTLEFLDGNGVGQSEALATAGASASSPTSLTGIRLNRVYVSKSGTYATQSAGSHSADIVIENSAGGTDWATIDSTDFARGQGEIGAYSVPLGKTAYVLSIHISVASNKTADVLFFKREGILKSAAPYDAMRIQVEFGAVSGEEYLVPEMPMGPYPALTDIGFMAKAATSAEVDVDFEILLIDS